MHDRGQHLQSPSTLYIMAPNYMSDVQGSEPDAVAEVDVARVACLPIVQVGAEFDFQVLESLPEALEKHVDGGYFNCVDLFKTDCSAIQSRRGGHESIQEDLRCATVV